MQIYEIKWLFAHIFYAQKYGAQILAEFIG